jgi:outer membrane biosynthesis protein TonB
MAKKKTNPQDTSVPPAAPRRRAPKKAASAASAAAPDTTTPSGNGGAEPTQAEIAEAAYFRHLNRRGAQGDEFRDWIEAERELRQRHSR